MCQIDLWVLSQGRVAGLINSIPTFCWVLNKGGGGSWRQSWHLCECGIWLSGRHMGPLALDWVTHSVTAWDKSPVMGTRLVRFHCPREQRSPVAYRHLLPRREGTSFLNVTLRKISPFLLGQRKQRGWHTEWASSSWKEALVKEINCYP